MESPSMLAPNMVAVEEPRATPFVHRHYILLKAHYFLFFSSFGTLYPILSITLRARGLSNTEISYMNLIIPFLLFFTNPLMGFIADRSRRFLLTFNLVLAITTILYVLLFALPSIKSHQIQADMHQIEPYGRVLEFCASQEVSTKCSSRSECGCIYQANCTLSKLIEIRDQDRNFNFNFTMNSKQVREEIDTAIGRSEPLTCGINYRVPIDLKSIDTRVGNFDQSLSPLATCEITCSIAHFCHGSRYTEQTSYILLYSLVFVIGTNLFMNAITIGASIGFATLSSADLFGHQRVWGTYGFGLSAFAASRAREYFKTDYVYIFMFTVTTCICILITSFIHIQPHRQRQKPTTNGNDEDNDDAVVVEQEMIDYPIKSNENVVTKKKKKKNKKTSQFNAAALLPLLKKVDVIVFLSLTFIWGMSYGCLDPYIYLYIDEIAPCKSRSIVGWMSLISASSEVIALFVSAKLLKWLGTNISSLVILLAFAVRFGGYFLIREPYFILPMETMHFFNFGILYVFIAQKADAIAPPGLAGTLQGVAYGVSFGLGRGVGLIVSSLVYTFMEHRRLFLIFSIFNLTAAAFYAVYFFFNRKNSSETNTANNNVPKIVVIESDSNVNEEPLLLPSSANAVINE